MSYWEGLSADPDASMRRVKLDMCKMPRGGGVYTLYASSAVAPVPVQLPMLPRQDGAGDLPWRCRRRGS